MRFLNTVLSMVFAVACAACFTASNPGIEPVSGENDEQVVANGTEENGPDDAILGESPETTADAGLVEEIAEPEPIPEPEIAEEVIDPAVLQSRALEQCQSAAVFLDQGHIEDAIAALDGAYQLLLDLPVEDNGYLQVKEDLRILVADLVLRAYASQSTVATDEGTSFDLEIQIVENDHVKRELKSFSSTEKAVFLAAYERSGTYRPMMLKKLEEAGMPSQLSWLPLVESNFKLRALSRASALGLWQFISSTGQRYGMSRDSWVDERLDPEKATDAAIAYLSDLHGMFGDWPKALAGYNCGEGRVRRLGNRRPGEYLDFWDLYSQLPRETRRYVPRFFATLMIIDNPSAYGMTLPEPLPPVEETTLAEISRSVELATLDKALGLGSGTLRELNPELRHKATPDREYQLKVPTAKAPIFTASLASVPVWSPPTPQYVTHRVRKGETLSRIGSRYGTSVSSIMRVNNIRSAHRIWPGQRLKIPVRGGRRASSAPATFDAATGNHTVRRGDSLYSIASRYHTTVARLKADNKLSSNLINPGQKLKVRPGSRTDLKRYKVKKGDTLGTIADRHSVRLSSLLSSNGLGRRSTIFPGQWLVIPD